MVCLVFVSFILAIMKIFYSIIISHEDEAPHYHSRHTLMGLDENSAAFNHGATGLQVKLHDMLVISVHQILFVHAYM